VEIDRRAVRLEARPVLNYVDRYINGRELRHLPPDVVQLYPSQYRRLAAALSVSSLDGFTYRGYRFVRDAT
jgi:hypothetical protein